MSSSGDEKCSSVNEDVSCVESVTNIASIVGDNESIPVSYATMNTERMEKESDKISMKGNPVCFYDFNQFSTLLATKKTTNESNPMNLKRYIDHYNISVNKILSLESVFGRRKIHLQGKEMTLISDGKMNNCDKDIFVIEEVTRTHSICSLLSAKNKAPILSKLSFIHPELIGTQKKRAFLLDLAFLHSKKYMPMWCLIDNALSCQDFNEAFGKKPSWYDEVKTNHEIWERAWTEGSFFSLKWDGIWVTLENKKVKVAITSPDTGMWYEAIQVLDLQLKSEHYDSLQQRFFFMWTYMSTRFSKLLKIKSPAPSKKVEKKRTLDQRKRS